MNAQLLQNCGIISPGKHDRSLRISVIGRTPKHQPGGGKIAARNQGIGPLQRNGDFVGIEAMERFTGRRRLLDGSGDRRAVL